jgi:hypothetical protein
MLSEGKTINSYPSINRSNGSLAEYQVLAWFILIFYVTLQHSQKENLEVCLNGVKAADLAIIVPPRKDGWLTAKKYYLHWSIRNADKGFIA